jgi:hypothetical protein
MVVLRVCTCGYVVSLCSAARGCLHGLGRVQHVLRRMLVGVLWCRNGQDVELGGGGGA